MNEPLFDVAVVTYNTKDLLLECLESLQGEEALGRIVVSDDNSSDGTLEAVRERFPGVEILLNLANRGFAAVANAAIEACSTSGVLLLNADTRVTPGTLARLGAYLADHPKASIVGPRLINADGSLQPSCFPFPSPRAALLGETGLGSLLSRIRVLRKHHLRTWAHDRPRSVPWVRGAALMIRRETFLEAGGFDTDFYMYFEEVDLALRLSEAGWEVHFAPVADVYHLGGASTTQQRAKMRLRYYASMQEFYRRHRRPWERVALRSILLSTMAFRSLRDRLRLLVSRTPESKERLREDVEVWRQVIVGS